MPGACRTRNLAWENSNDTSIVTTVTAGFTRHSRTRMVLTVSFVLFPAIGLSCHRRRRDAKHRRQLDASVETASARFPKFVHPCGSS
jgi:hypothetical protein